MVKGSGRNSFASERKAENATKSARWKRSGKAENDERGRALTAPSHSSHSVYRHRSVRTE